MIIEKYFYIVIIGMMGLFVGCWDDNDKAVCGNGIVEGDETCDGNDLRGFTCQDFVYTGGELKCSADCRFDYSDCFYAVCGNGVAEHGEICDDTDLRGETCVSQGYDNGGDLACLEDCSGFDTSGCLGAIVLLQGVTWSPGADLAETLEDNRFPIPGALVAASMFPHFELPQEMYCNDCINIMPDIPYVFSDPVDGSFELALHAERSYYLLVQKGNFSRVREIYIPETPDGIITLESEASGAPKPEETTLPNTTDLDKGDNIPKIAIIYGEFEDMSIMFEALGFDYHGEFSVYKERDEVSNLVGSWQNLAKYNLIIAPCGLSWVGGPHDVENIKEYVRHGGRLYINGFSYDFAEQVWPEFLAFYVKGANGGHPSICGDGPNPPSEPFVCNEQAGSWDFVGVPGDEDFAGWIALPDVNANNLINLKAARNSIYEINSGEVGICYEHGTGPNGELYLPPRVWMYGKETPAGADKPTTVSWPFYCGKVLYTVYNTQSDYSFPYKLSVQDKIMMYLIMEIQLWKTTATCITVDPIFETTIGSD